MTARLITAHLWGACTFALVLYAALALASGGRP